MPHTLEAPLRLKKSSVPGKVPLVTDLNYGELAINYADGILRYKTADNQIAAFPQARITITPTWASSMTIDLLNGRVDVVQITLTGSTSFAFTNAAVGQKFIMEVTQGVGGNKIFTWPNDVRMTLGLQRSYAPSATAGLMDRIGFIYTGSTFDLVAFSLGYTP
jgi:hypothetical protein